MGPEPAPAWHCDGVIASARLQASIADLRRAERRAGPFAGAVATYSGDFPDPYVERFGEKYWAYGTQAAGMNLPVLRSDDLSAWALVGDALPTMHRWAAPGRTWSPAILARADRYVMYHAVREPVSDRQCIAAAAAASPDGPFVDAVGGPFVFQRERGGSIDPSVFVDACGRTYLLWKSDDNAIGGSSSLWGQELSADGLALQRRPTELLRRDRAWERPLVEAPAMVRAGDLYYLFYSANWWESERYCIGYAVGPSALGPFSKITRRGPWMVSGPDAAGPGGQEFFHDSGGALWMAYHAWAPERAGYERGGRRSLRLSKIGFADGRPIVQPGGHPSP